MPAHLLTSVQLGYLLLGFAILLLGVTKSGFGAGVGLIIVPLTTLAMSRLPGGEPAALGLLLPLLTAGDLIAIYQYRKLLDFRLLRMLLLPTLLGVIVGAALLYGIDYLGKRSALLAVLLIRLEIGLECTILVGLHYYGQLRGTDRKLLPEPARSWLAGSYSGISSTLAHAAGPVISLYLLPLRLPRETYVGTCALFFGALNLAKFPAYFAAGAFSHSSFAFTARWLPLVLLGALLGRWIVKKVNDKLFGNIVYATTMAVGIYLIADATVRMLQLL